MLFSKPAGKLRINVMKTFSPQVNKRCRSSVHIGIYSKVKCIFAFFLKIQIKLQILSIIRLFEAEIPISAKSQAEGYIVRIDVHGRVF
ncbi:hypothetical protein SDC9_194875 [bioreactor metagenome]|uniref:Uncharacterized protein n=1 Tax=bioreactor metagenome TaxID=1076179 RepID=A0A645IIV1_9ZZZZ